MEGVRSQYAIYYIMCGMSEEIYNVLPPIPKVVWSSAWAYSRGYIWWSGIGAGLDSVWVCRSNFSKSVLDRCAIIESIIWSTFFVEKNYVDDLEWKTWYFHLFLFLTAIKDKMFAAWERFCRSPNDWFQTWSASKQHFYATVARSMRLRK